MMELQALSFHTFWGLALFDYTKLKEITQFTLHLNGKNLSTNSPWGFEHIFDTMNYCWLCPEERIFHSTLPTRWRCNHFSKKWPKPKLDTTFTIKKLLLPLLSVSEIFLGCIVLEKWIFCPEQSPPL